MAARPATLTAAATPVIVGSSLAILDDSLRIDALIVALLSAVAIQVGVNFANDVADARRGADNPSRVGPPRVVAEGILTDRQVTRGTWIAFAIATAGGVYLTAIAGWVIVIIGVVSIAAALTYTGGPLPYGYHGLGEVSVFVFFGLVATVGSRYIHDRSAPMEAWLLAVPIGLLITAILVANNVRDIASDEAADKRTLAVLMGRRRSSWFYASLLIGAAGLTAVFGAAELTPRWSALGLLAFWEAPRLIRIVLPANGPSLIAALEGTARLQAVFGALVTIGIVMENSL